VRIGPAIETLASLQADPFDIALIDADKENLLAYYERVLSLIRPGGLVLIDNTLWNGSVADEGNGTAATQAVRELNRRVHDDVRVEVVLVPVGDGLTIARKAA
jgi:O-methyltransferase